ncbi:type III secretion system chaperone [Pseudoalteromonas spongiae]|uniref:type III secretion system chaperone n=1 Tax=Pseudoalteromonas spongiae TaxID=298657 RepID=UPI000C2D1A05|nr:type III secretion system chaperone [Pseudoalteromonas spongiae]
MKQFKLMVEEACALLEVTPQALSDEDYQVNLEQLVFRISCHPSDGTFGLKAALAKPTSDLPSSVYNLMLNANATGVQLQGCKVGIDAASNQIVLVKLLPSVIQEGEQLAQKILSFTQVALFWQMTLTIAKDDMTDEVMPFHSSLLSV